MVVGRKRSRQAPVERFARHVAHAIGAAGLSVRAVVDGGAWLGRGRLRRQLRRRRTY